MNRTLFSKIREALSPTLEADSGTGMLDEEEKATVVALFETLTADPDFPAPQCLKHVDMRTGSNPGYLKAYRDGLNLLDNSAKKHTSGVHFRELDCHQRDAVLRQILRRYPHPSNEFRWRRRFRITGSHLDRALSSTATKRFRDFVVRDLLQFYYQGDEGWRIVDYDEFPGHVRHDREPCEVVRIINDDDGRLLLEMSDATVEELDPSGLVADEDFMLTVSVKSGRQRAGFARAAYYEFVERIDMEEDRFVLRLGDDEYEIPCTSEEDK